MSKNSISKYIMLLVDLFSFFISLPLTIWIIEQLKWDLYIYIPQSELEDRFIIHLCLSILCVCWFWMRLRHYTYRKPFWFELKEILRTVLIFAVIELAIVGFSKLYFSRSIWVIMWPITCFTVAFFRVATKVILIKTGMYLKNTIIVGGGKNAVEAVNAIRRETYLGLCIKYIISSNSSSELQALNIPVILTKDNEVEDLITSRDDQFIIALEDEEVELRDSWLRNLIRKKYRFISVIPTLRGLPLYSTDVSFLFSYDIMLLRINHNLAKRSSKIMKRGMDILVSFLSIILLLPLLCVIFFIILISGGKPIYGHNRVGLNGQTFKCWKFRTMKKDADNLLEQLLKNDPIANQQWQAERKLKGDPRITRFGRWMRKYSVDELPQLWNVLVGQMSLVGPRPVTESELKYYNDDITYYLMAKPGMTGLWQVSGRNNVDYETRVYFDAWYVKNWSLWNDIAILFKTVNVVLKRDGAY